MIAEKSRVLTSAGRVATSDGRVGFIENKDATVTLELNVIGTHFPAGKNDQDTFLRLDNYDNKDGSIDIDYADGTGWHNYSFKSSGAYRRMDISRKALNSITPPITPSNISKTGTYNYPVYFYQDLPLPSGTVDDDYNHLRTVKIRINQFQYLKVFWSRFLELYGLLSSSFSKLRNIYSFKIENAKYLTGFENGFTKLFCNNLSMSNSGIDFGDVIPDFILNSPSLAKVDMDNWFDFSSPSVTPSSSNMDIFLSEQLPNLIGFSFTGCKFNNTFRIPNPTHDITGQVLFGTCRGLSLFSTDLSKWKCSYISFYYTSLSTSEAKRLLEGLICPKIRMHSIDNITSDFDLSANNTTLVTHYCGSPWSGSFPTYLLKLKALETLRISCRINTPNPPTSWGTVGISDSLKDLTVERMATNFSTNMPTWFTTLVNLTDFKISVYLTLARINSFIDSFYSMVDANSPKTGTGLFRSLNFDISGNVVIPTGTYQQPTGYTQGTNNGTPASQMEKIWVLVHQYNMIVTVRNANDDGNDIYTP